MLTRLKVTGFKNLVDVDVSFGPFTCVAGANGVGKSNLFDAIAFLGALANRPLHEAASSVRSEEGRGADVQSLFHRSGAESAREMVFEAEMLIPGSGSDDLGQETEAAATFLRYRLALGLEVSGLTVRREELERIDPRQSTDHLVFPHSLDWQQSVVRSNLRQARLISTEADPGETRVIIRQKLGRPLPRRAERLTATVLSTATAAVNPTAALVRREMQGWRLLQFEPSALRAADSFAAPRAIASNGAHLAAALARISGIDLSTGLVSPASPAADVERAALYARIANRLAGLVEGVRSVRVDVDERRELLTLVLEDWSGTEHEARVLSDGTLRFLALAVLESDPEARGVFCIEEPENGVHPERIPAMLQLLQDLAVDPSLPVDEDNPLRQVIVNTHSPLVARQVPDDSLLIAVPGTIRREGRVVVSPDFRWLPGTWRAERSPGKRAVALGQLLSYLNPVDPLPEEEKLFHGKRVIDRDDVQQWLPFSTEKS